MEIKNVVVIGGGVLGSQIAYQAAYCGFDVTIWLRSEGSIGRCQPKVRSFKRGLSCYDYSDGIAMRERHLKIGPWVLVIMKILIKNNV
ncbi:3-hydroxyacyl-CoA dehydrogenase NAD-binding domain-containing protein [Faecalibacillus intestinalis]|uniref:3-hydroxyacyl-CoA dehydrogenase NAD-binding domain-containing protein n=1 Tax=Faecalibacillus intestinalis TaxID=1982626 RepID=UPI0035215F2C